MTRALSLGLCLSGGLVTGAVSVVWHQRWWGLALVAAALAATAAALPAGWFTRLPYAAGFVVPLCLGMLQRGEGDYLVPANGRGYLLIGLTFLLVLVAVATLPRPGGSLESAP